MGRTSVLCALVCVVCYLAVFLFPPAAWATACDGFGATFVHEGPMVMDWWSCHWNQVLLRAIGRPGPQCCPFLYSCSYDQITTSVDNSSRVYLHEGENCILELWPRVEVDRQTQSTVTWRFVQAGESFPPIDISHTFICP